MAQPTVRPGVTADDSPRRAAFRLLTHHARRLARHAEALREGSRDPEDVHDMRVATRRLRAVLDVFAPWLPRKASRRLADGLRAFTRRLGAVRELDVLLGSLEASPRGAAADAARQDLARLRDEARARLDRALHGDRLAALGTDLDRFLAALDEDADETPGRLALEAPVLVFEAVADARAAAPDLVPTLDDLHALRIRMKRLRYTVEALSEVLGTGGADFLAAVREVQDDLGALQDARVAADRIDGWLAAAAVAPRSARPLAAWARRRREAAEAGRAAFPARWAAFEASGLRQRLAAACADL